MGRTPSKAQVEKESDESLKQKYEEALATINQMSANMASMAASLGAQHRNPITGQLVVGVRNVSNYVVSFTDETTGTPVHYTLTPDIPGITNPKNRAVVSYAFWQSFRTNTKIVGRGLIIRDDSVLGAGDSVAPPDRDSDVHPEAKFNVVLHAREWITSRDEHQLRHDITLMTSEPSLRRIIETVDREIFEIGESKYRTDPDKPRKAIRDLPALFRIAEELAYERMDELNPAASTRDAESWTLEDYLTHRRGARK